MPGQDTPLSQTKEVAAEDILTTLFERITQPEPVPVMQE